MSDAAHIDLRLQRIERQLAGIETRAAGLQAVAEEGAQFDQRLAEAVERILTLISAEPASGESDLAETLRQLVAATQANGELLAQLLRGIRSLPREIAEHVARETVA